MERLEREIRFTPAEQRLFKLQRETVEEWGIPQDILNQARVAVESKRREVGEGYFAFARRAQQPVESLHFVAWEERVSRGQIYGEVGRVTASEDGEHIQCHLCGGWFVVLSGTHLLAHGLEDGDAYRSLLGLNQTQPLCSPKFSDLKRRQEAEIGSRQYFFGEGEPFIEGFDERRMGPKRPQFAKDRRDLMTEKRLRGELPHGYTPDHAEIRRLYGGHFSLFRKYYFFSKRAEGDVEIEVSNDEVRAKGYIDGQLVVKTYQRKDL